MTGVLLTADDAPNDKFSKVSGPLNGENIWLPRLVFESFGLMFSFTANNLDVDDKSTELLHDLEEKKSWNQCIAKKLKNF